MTTNFSGGGILPIVKISRDGKETLCFVTFSSRRGVLSDAGGKCDFGETIQKTCTREFFEESCKLFDISSDTLSSQNFIDISAGRTFYRSYVPLIDINLVNNLFLKNRMSLKSSTRKRYYFEKTEMVLIPVDVQLSRLDLNSNKVYTTKDINGQSILVNRRLYKLIRDFRNSGKLTTDLLLERNQIGELVTYFSK